MRLNSLSITHKGYLLVTIPLLFMVIVGLTLMHLTREADVAALREAKAKAVAFQISECGKRFFEIGALLGLYASTRRVHFAEQYDELRKQVPNDIASLDQLCTHTPQQEANLEAMHKQVERSLMIWQESKIAIDERDTTAFAGAVLRGQSFNSYASLTALMKKIGETESQYYSAYAKLQPARDRLQIAIGVAMAASFVITLISALFFSRNITGRLMPIVRNARLLAAGKLPCERVSGQDEIAYVDQVFHEMSDAIVLAAMKERAVLDNAQAIICSLTDDFQFVKINSGTTAIWGRDSDVLIGKKLWEVIPVDEQSTVASFFQAARSGDFKSSGECRIVRGDGKNIFMLWSVLWSEGEKQFFCVAHDITERKELEQLKADFLNIVSHDLRGPLAGMLGYLDCMIEGLYGDLNDKGKNNSQRIRTNLEYLIRMINDLLDMEKIECGAATLVFKPMRLDATVEAGIELVQDLALTQRVNIEYASLPVTISGDSDRLVQVVQNLVANAIKYSPEGSVVNVEMDALDDVVEVRVRDCGPGIDPNFQEFVFDRFRQVPGQRKGGSGLGLAISRALITEHGGTIGVQSKVGKGSTFWFRLPIERQEQEILHAEPV